MLSAFGLQGEVGDVFMQIYNVATSEAYRRRGIGSAVMAHAVLEGQAAGGRLAVLQSSEMEQGVYRSLGFRDDVAIGLYLG